MNKQELIYRIGRIPKFVLRDIAVQQALDKIFGEDGKVIYKKGKPDWIENKDWKAVTEEDNVVPITFVSKRYTLIQFSQVFLPLLQDIPELDGKIIYWHGKGLMDVFPNDEKLKVNGGDKIGLVALNSVDKTTSVIIKFCINHQDKIITIPKNIAGLKRMHVGKAFEITQNFLTVVDKVREVWKSILNEFIKIRVDDAYCKTMLSDIKINEEYLRKKVLKRVMSQEMNVWDVFVYMMEVIAERGFKSDYHRRKKLDVISEKIFKWAVACRLINA